MWKAKIISDGSIAFEKNVPEGVIAYTRKHDEKRLSVWGNLTKKAVAVDCGARITERDIFLQNYENMPDCDGSVMTLRPYEFIAVWC